MERGKHTLVCFPGFKSTLGSPGRGKPAKPWEPSAVRLSAGSGFLYPWGLRGWPDGISFFFRRESSQSGAQGSLCGGEKEPAVKKGREKR